MVFRAQKKTKKSAALSLDGELTKERAEEVRSALIKALDKTDEVLLKFNRASRADLTCLQLLCSAHRTATKMNKRIAFNGKFPAVLHQAAIAAGFIRCHGCDLDREKSCLWVENCW